MLCICFLEKDSFDPARVVVHNYQEVISTCNLENTAGPNHPSCGSSGARGGLWVKLKMAVNSELLQQKSKMAAKVEFTEKLRAALQRAKTDCLSEISTGKGIKEVNDFFKELDGAAGVLEHKYSQRSRDSNIQRTNFGHEFSETNTQMLYKIIDLRKAKYLYTRMDIDGAEVDRENILKK